MALFDGVENFNPTFQGRQLAIQSGQGAGQSISRGMATAQRGEAFKIDQELLDTMTGRLRKKLKQSPSGPAVPWSQMPIPSAANARPSGEAVPWDEMPIPDAMTSDLPPAYGGIIGSGGPVGMGLP